MIILMNKNLFSTFFASSFFLSWLFDNQEIIGIISYHIITGNKKISMIDKNSIHVNDRRDTIVNSSSKSSHLYKKRTIESQWFTKLQRCAYKSAWHFVLDNKWKVPSCTISSSMELPLSISLFLGDENFQYRCLWRYRLIVEVFDHVSSL